MIRALLLAAAASGLFVSAAVAGETTLTSQVFKEVETKAADGQVQTSLSPVDRVTPGEQVVYVLTYHNGGEAPASGVVVTNPLPKDVTYAGPRGDRTAQVSVDGARFGELSTLSITRDGQPTPAGTADVTALRWTLNQAVPAGGEVTMSYRARLN